MGIHTYSFLVWLSDSILGRHVLIGDKLTFIQRMICQSVTRIKFSDARKLYMNECLNRGLTLQQMDMLIENNLIIDINRSESIDIKN